MPPPPGQPPVDESGVEPRLLAAKEKIVATLGPEYEAMSPREAIEKAYDDPRVNERGRQQLYDNFGEHFLQSVGKSFVRSTGLDTLARAADYVNPAVVGGNLAHKVFGAPKPQQHGALTWAADQVEQAPLQRGVNTVGNMVGGVGGAVAAHVALAPLAAAKDAALVARYAPTVARMAPKTVAALPDVQLALRMALQGGTAASQNYEAQLDQIKQGDRTEINTWGPTASFLTSATGMYGAGKIFNPRGEELWSKGNKAIQAGNKWAGRTQKALAPLVWGAVPAGIEEGTQAGVEQVGDYDKLTPSGRASTPSITQRALLGGAFGGLMEMPSRVGKGWNAVIPDVPSPSTVQQPIVPPGPPPPAAPGVHARQGGDILPDMQGPPAPQGNISQIPGWQLLTGLTTPAEQAGVKRSAAHFARGALKATREQVAKAIQIEAPSYVLMPRDATSADQGMKVWKIGDDGGRYGIRPEDGEIVDLSVNFNPSDYNVVKWMPNQALGPGDPGHIGYTYNAELRGVPSNAMIEFEHGGAPHIVVARQNSTNPNQPMKTVAAVPKAQLTPGNLVEAVTIEFDPEVQAHIKAQEELELQLGKAAAEMAAKRKLQEIRDWRQLKGIATMSNLEKHLQNVVHRGASLFQQLFGQGGGTPPTRQARGGGGNPAPGPAAFWPPGTPGGGPASPAGGTGPANPRPNQGGGGGVAATPPNPRNPNPQPSGREDDPFGDMSGGESDEELARRLGGEVVETGEETPPPPAPTAAPVTTPPPSPNRGGGSAPLFSKEELNASWPQFPGADPVFTPEELAQLARQNAPNQVNPEGSSARVVPYRASQQELAAQAERLGESINQAIETAGLPGPNSAIGKEALAASEAPDPNQRTLTVTLGGQPSNVAPNGPPRVTEVTPERAQAKAVVASWFDGEDTPDTTPAAAPERSPLQSIAEEVLSGNTSSERPARRSFVDEAAEDAVANGFPGTAAQARAEIIARAQQMHNEINGDETQQTGLNLLKTVARLGGVAVKGDGADFGERKRFGEMADEGKGGSGHRRTLGGVANVYRAIDKRRGSSRRRAGHTFETMREALGEEGWEFETGDHLMKALEDAARKINSGAEDYDFDPAKYAEPLGIGPGSKWWEDGQRLVKVPRPKAGGEGALRVQEVINAWEMAPSAATRKAATEAIRQAVAANQITKGEGTAFNKILTRKK